MNVATRDKIAMDKIVILIHGRLQLVDAIWEEANQPGADNISYGKGKERGANSVFLNV
jgi:hypothetical protein